MFLLHFPISMSTLYNSNIFHRKPPHSAETSCQRPRCPSPQAAPQHANGSPNTRRPQHRQNMRNHLFEHPHPNQMHIHQHRGRTTHYTNTVLYNLLRRALMTSWHRDGRCLTTSWINGICWRAHKGCYLIVLIPLDWVGMLLDGLREGVHRTCTSSSPAPSSHFSASISYGDTWVNLLGFKDGRAPFIISNIIQDLYLATYIRPSNLVCLGTLHTIRSSRKRGDWPGLNVPYASSLYCRRVLPPSPSPHPTAHTFWCQESIKLSWYLFQMS